MKKNYIGLWCILAVAFVAFVAISFIGDFTVGGVTVKSSSMADALVSEPSEATPGGISSAMAKATAPLSKPVEVDTMPKTILFFGDSMLDGLGPRLAAYCDENGHTLYRVIWYSSTSEIWGQSDKIKKYINQLHPDFIFVCLGANELFVKDIKTKRDKYVKAIVNAIGNIPFVWIGPPNWKEDTGINELIASNVPQGSFFLSNGMKFERKKDGAHPTNASSALWMDSVARWMPKHCNHPIRMKKPKKQSGNSKRTFVHQPSER